LNNRRELKRDLEEARERVDQLEEELAKTQRGLNALSLELESRVEARTRALEERLDQFQRLFNGTGDAIYIHDPDGNLLEVNDEATSRMGYSKDELLSMKITDLRPPSDDSPIPNPDDNQVSFETTHLTNKNEEFIVEVIATSIIFDGNRAVLNVARDITERKKAETAREELLYDINERNKELGALYKVTKLSLEVDAPLEKIMEESVRVILDSWQYPEVTCARISVDGKGYASANFQKTDWLQSSTIKVNGKKSGEIEVGYLEERPESDEGPFLGEERELIDSLARIFGQMIEKRRAENRRDHLYSVLQSIRNVNQLIVEKNGRDKLIEGACENLVETRGFHHVWIAFMNDSNELIKASEAGLGEDFEPMRRLLEDGDLPDHVQRALNTPEVISVSNPYDNCQDCPLVERCRDSGILTTRLEYEGNIYGVLSTSVPLQFIDDDEELGLLQEVAGDISLGLHNIEVEEALQKSERRHRSLFNSIRDAILVADTDRNITNCNPAFTELFGYELNEILGEKTEFVYHDSDDYEKMGEELAKSSEDPNFFFTIDYEKKSGEVFPGETNVFHLRDDQGEVKGFIGLIRDITERITREKALEKSEKLYRTVFEGTGTAMFIEDESEKIARVNAEFENLTGYSAEVAEAGMDPQNLVAEEDLEMVRRYHEIRMEDPEKAPSKYKITMKCKNGDKKEVLVTVNRVPGSNQFISSFVDITELIETRQELRQSFVELAETTSRVLGVRDPYTQQHEQRVAKLAREVGRRAGLEEEKLLGLYLGGILHDIGKIAIPETILTKPGKLKEVEWKMIKSHPEVGYNQILKDTNFPWPVAEMTLRHHERLDGSGYPNGIEGDQLSLEVRILSVCDVVEAMSTRRPYREARSRSEVLEELTAGSGIKYDPDVVDILLEMIDDGEVRFNED